MGFIQTLCIITTVISVAHCDSILDVVDDIVHSETDESGVLKPTGSPLQAATRKKFNSQVAGHYKEGVASYNSLLDAVESDLNAAVDTEYAEYSDLIPKEISAAAKQAAKRFQAQLTSASKNCDKLVKELDAKAVAKSKDVSKLEAKIRLHQTSLSKAKSKRDGAKKAVDLAEQNLKSKQNDMRTHEEAVRRYERKVKKARNKCGRGWLFKKFCSLVNAITGDLRRAKRDRRRARNTLNDSRNKHAAAVRNLNTENGKYQAVLREMEKLRQKQSIERVSLHVAKKDRDQVDGLNIKMKRSLTIINNIKGGAENLKHETDLESYLDVDNVVIPLKEIGETIAGLSGTGTTFIPKLTDAEIKAIKDKLHRIKASG